MRRRIIVDDILIAELKNRLAFDLQRFKREAFVFGGIKAKRLSLGISVWGLPPGECDLRTRRANCCSASAGSAFPGFRSTGRGRSGWFSEPGSVFSIEPSSLMSSQRMSSGRLKPCTTSVAKITMKVRNKLNSSRKGRWVVDGQRYCQSRRERNHSAHSCPRHNCDVPPVGMGIEPAKLFENQPCNTLQENPDDRNENNRVAADRARPRRACESECRGRTKRAALRAIAIQ